MGNEIPHATSEDHACHTDKCLKRPGKINKHVNRRRGYGQETLEGGSAAQRPPV